MKRKVDEVYVATYDTQVVTPATEDMAKEAARGVTTREVIL